ncbi:unnamed protein product [Sphagnum balticum]
MGPTGTGKTHALATIAETGAEVLVLFIENGLETFVGYWTDRGEPIPPNVHWHILSRPIDSFKTMAATAISINTMAQEALHKMQDVNRAKHNQYVNLLNAFSDFKDHRTGQSFGAVDSWGPDRVLCIDSLSGINPIVMSLVVGGKPVKSQADWGIAMDQIEKLIRQLTDGCKCHIIMTAHVEREIDQVFGGVKISVSTLGSKLAPKLPPMFSDVVLSSRDGNKFSWTTAAPNADLKARNLPIADGIQPTFKQIFDKWQSRGGRFSPIVKT